MHQICPFRYGVLDTAIVGGPVALGDHKTDNSATTYAANVWGGDLPAWPRGLSGLFVWFSTDWRGYVSVRGIIGILHQYYGGAKVDRTECC